MPVYKTHFNGKKITLMGLGLLGRGVGDAMFLAEQGATLMVTDLRDEKILAPSLAKLEKYKDIRYRLGEHRREDFRDKDFILKAAGVSLDSPYIAEARKHGIPIEMDASLFAKLMPKGVIPVGVTGTRGKSTTAECIYAILKAAKKRVFLGGVVHTATLPLLTKVRSGDIVVLELDSWQLQGFHDAKLSPHVGVFTTFMDDHLLYYKGNPKAPMALGHARKRYFDDKTAIFRYQKRDDTLIVGEQAAEKIKNQKSKIKIIKAMAQDVPKKWNIRLLGEHNRTNIACAVAAARALGISESVIRRTVEAFRGVPGRLEYLWTVKGVKIYNDNNATTPDATIAALRALNSKSETLNPRQISKSKSLNAKRYTLNAASKRIILIMGGTDKGLDMSGLIAEIPKHCKAVVFLKETGTEKLISNFPAFAKAASAGRQFPRLRRSGFGGQAISNKFSIFKKNTLKECVEQAIKIAQKGDIVLFSPAFASFGKWFKNEYDRGEQFVGLIRRL